MSTLEEVFTPPAGLPVLDMQVTRASLRCALAGILPHTGDTVSLARIRLVLTDEKTLICLASSGSTALAARAHVQGVAWADELPVVDIEPRSAREILAVFIPPRDKDERSSWERQAFRVRVTDDELTVSEPAGMLDDLDRTLVVPRLPPDADEARKFPDLARLLLSAINEREAKRSRARVTVKLVEPFLKSAKAYGIDTVTLRFFETKHGALVHISDDAVGIAGGGERHPAHDTEDAEMLADTWSRRLTDLQRQIIDPAKEADL